MVDAIESPVVWAHGESSARGAIGANNKVLDVTDQDVDDSNSRYLFLDVRGMTLTSVYVENTGANQATISLYWYVSDYPFRDGAEDYVVAGGATDIREFPRSADYVALWASSALGTTIKVALEACHGG